MCGRYGRWSRKERVQALLDGVALVDEVADLPASYNAAPGVLQPIIRMTRDGKEARIQAMLWGLVPFWSKDPKAGIRPINAKIESAAERPMFRKLLRERRCLVPADCFYEWQSTPAGKIPHAIQLASGEPFFLAGLWDVWRGADDDPLYTFTILTGEPNELTRKFHNRMPLIIRPEDAALWLDPKVQEVEKLERLLQPFPAEEMLAYSVSTRVNNVKNDAPDLIERA